MNVLPINTAQWRSLLQRGHRAYSQGRFQDAEQYYRDAIRTARDMYGLMHPTVGESLSFLGYVLSHEDRYAEAESAYTLALCAYEKSLGFLSAHVLMTLRKLREIRRLRQEPEGERKAVRQVQATLGKVERNLLLLSSWKMRSALKENERTAIGERFSAAGTC